MQKANANLSSKTKITFRTETEMLLFLYGSENIWICIWIWIRGELTGGGVEREGGITYSMYNVVSFM